MPVQVVGDAGDPLWREVESDAGDPRVGLPETRRLFTEEMAAVFDLARGPVLRCTLVRHSDARHVLLLALPALCADARTLDGLVADLGRAYEAFLRGEGLEEEEVPYVQFSEWQNELLEDGGDDEGAAFWRGQPPPTTAPPLPLEKTAEAGAAFEPRDFELAVPPELAARLDEAAAARGAAPEVFLLASWQTLLGRLTGREEVAVHLRCEGRVYEEMQAAAGLYERWPPVRSRFAGGPSFAEVLGQTGEAVRGAREWQEYFSPEWHAPEGAAFGFSYDEWPGPTDAGGLRWTIVERHSRTDRFKLRLACERPAGGPLTLVFHYDPALYEEEEVRRLAGRYATLLGSAAARPDAPAARLDILEEAERRQLLGSWNETAADYALDRTLPELFEAQAARTPDAEAVVYGDERLSYRELNGRANRLARLLRRLGVGPECRVALCMERSAEMVVALLGVLKAGGVYVPLDPAQPKPRLAQMLEDAKPVAVLTQARVAELLPESRAQRVCLDTDWQRLIAPEKDGDLPSNLSPDNLAYVIYTSGSTGRPKGVMIRHASAVNLAAALERAVYGGGGGAPLRVSLNAPLAFDSSVKQLLQLLSGHALYVLPEDVRRDGGALLDYVERHRLDVLECTPSQLRPLVDAGLLEKAEGVPERLLIGGEPVDASLWDALAACGRTAAHNLYGPTECTVDATACLVNAALARPSIGRPLANAQTYVLDEQLQPVPVGVAGELYVGGAGVARGYFERPAATAERFVPDPFSTEPGARLYRTGDLARHLPDGNLEFLGRADFQVKIRGSRIELGEVEAALAAHAGVRDCVVVVREDEPGDQRLVAYFVGARHQPPSTSDLHGFLRERLPEYMVPSAFVALPALPLTPNGKIDRAALPAPDHLRPELGADFVAPRTPTEDLLANVWASVLGVERVGVNDNFFELGGHSLLATQVTSQVRRTFHVELPLRNVFETPTVAGLALSVESAMRLGDDGGVQLGRVERDRPLPLSFSQQRLWILDQLDPRSTAYNVPFAVRLEGALDVSALERSLSETVRRHEVLRTTFPVVGGEPAQVIAPHEPLSLPTSDLQHLPVPEREAEARRLIEEEARKPFDLACGPLMRVRLLRLGAQEHVLLVLLHHIVFDAWSNAVLLREVAAHYQAYAAGDASTALPEPPIQYADFAHWQREQMRGEVLERHLSYWRRQLDGAARLKLPTDHRRPQFSRGAHHAARLPASAARELRALSRREGATLFMTLLAGFQALLHRYTGQEDISVGTPIANRTREEVEGLVGFFVNTLVLRARVEGGVSFRGLLGRVREAALGAYAHQDLPFEKLVEELQPERDLGSTPLFQVMFSMRNVADEQLSIPGLTLTPLAADTGTAKFDLLLTASEEADGITLGFEYNSDLFEADTISRMGEHLRTLLEAAAADPDRSLSLLPLLTSDERRSLLVNFNRTRVERPGGVPCAHQLFEAQAARAPEAVAVVHGEERLSYGELNERAERLAQRLRRAGVGPDVTVGVMLGRSPELVVGLLAVLKAGGAYVPLDPTHPAGRLRFFVEDAGVAAVLTERRLAESLPGVQAALIFIDAPPEPAQVAEPAQPAPSASPESMAYVLYTSGSTGQPKGVMVTHRGLVNYLQWCTDAYDVAGGGGAPVHSPVTFDLTVTSLFAPLAAGRPVTLLPQEEGVEALRDMLERSENLSLVKLTPAHLAVLAETLPPEKAAGRTKTLVVGGEALREEHVAFWRTHAPETEIVNEYGPTETVVGCCVYTLPAAPPTTETVPIGRPIANTQVYVLDRSMQPVPVGVTGEIYIGGDGLARGYLGRAALTAEKFVPDPFSAEPGARLYRTGDLARHLPEGDIEYLGRADEQVKVRGYRVEPGEIEATLGRHPLVRSGAVLLREDRPGDQRLVAYVVVEGDASGVVGELQSFLRQHLPAYMVPVAFVACEALPLTANGKVDRRALPAPEQSRLETGATYAGPRTALEELLAAHWAEVLGVERVGVEDNFFELGGHSLLATRLISRLREIFPVELPMRSLFESPTVAGVAEKMVRAHPLPEELENIAQTFLLLGDLSEEEAAVLLDRERQSA